MTKVDRPVSRRAVLALLSTIASARAQDLPLLLSHASNADVSPRLSPIPSCRDIGAYKRRMEGALVELARRVHDNFLAQERNEEGIRQKKLAVDKLNRERTLSEQEMRAGYYCSKCGRSKSQIEREDGISFLAHIQKVDAKIIPAPASVIEKMKAQYDRSIRGLYAQIENVNRENRELQALFSSELQPQTSVRFELWNYALGLHRDCLWRESEMRIRRATGVLNYATKQLQEARVRQRQLLANDAEPAEYLRAAGAVSDYWLAAATSARRSLDEANAFYWKNYPDFDSDAQRSYDRIVSQFRQAYRNFNVQLPTMNLNYRAITLQSTPSSIGLTYQIAPGVAASLRWHGEQTTQEVSALLTLANTFNIQAGMVTKETYDGSIFTAPTGSISLEPAR